MIERRVKQAIATQQGLSVEGINNTDLLSDLGDSLDEVEMLMAVEDEFDIDIPDAAAEKLKTVQQMIEYVSANQCKVPR